LVILWIIILQSRYNKNGIQFTPILLFVELVIIAFFINPMFDKILFINLRIYPFHLLFGALSSTLIYSTIMYSELIIYLYNKKLTIDKFVNFFNDIKKIW
jgi:hypothetical protein